MLFLSACSPKYKIVKEYHPPKISQDATNTSICLGNCEVKRTACKHACESAFQSCQVKAHRIANQRYAQKMQAYTAKLERYVDEVQMNNLNMQFYHFDYYGYPFYRPRYGYGPYGGYANSLFWYDPMPIYHYAPKPIKPSLEQEKLKAEAEFCDLDCGCTQKFDDCYIGCGGEVVSKKVCIENCP
jgi:hypothetical protein